MGGKIKISIVTAGLLGVNCLVLQRDGKAVVLDPGGDPELIDNVVGKDKLEAILLTHSHYDHIGAVNELLDEHPDARLFCHPVCEQYCRDPRENLSVMILGAPYALTYPAVHINDGEEFDAGGMRFLAFHVPGHATGQLCYYLQEAGALFAGDTVFAGSIGRSDFPGGDGELLVEKILAMLKRIPENTAIYPGHGACTTAGRELRSNPFLS